MNIYLDLNHVLLNREGQKANHANELIEFVASNSPRVFVLKNSNDKTVISPELASVLDNKQNNVLSSLATTSWTELKTEAIDTSKPFLWIDNDIWSDELEDLEAHNLTSSFILIDFNKNQDQLRDVIAILRKYEQ